MRKKVERPGVRRGYDQWAQVYDRTANPLVALDRRYTMRLLAPRPSERILDAGCGTGAHFGSMLAACSRPVGIDFSRGMLHVARQKFPAIPLAQGDLNEQLPVRRRVFDAVLCALVAEHLTNLPVLFGELFAGLRASGRLIFTVFHPEMAAAGIEANFEHAGVEYRLGANRHTVDDYLNVIDTAGFQSLRVFEFHGDEALVNEVPWATKYVCRPLMLAIEARRN